MLTINALECEENVPQQRSLGRLMKWLHANPQLQLPPNAPLDADGDPFYENNGAVRGFLACL